MRVCEFCCWFFWPQGQALALIFVYTLYEGI
jgi:hypothetical protein